MNNTKQPKFGVKLYQGMCVLTPCGTGFVEGYSNWKPDNDIRVTVRLDGQGINYFRESELASIEE
jgi:hypothetical protein